MRLRSAAATAAGRRRSPAGFPVDEKITQVFEKEIIGNT